MFNAVVNMSTTSTYNTFNWNNELVFELIKMFEEKPELWDMSSEHYNDRDKKQESWLEIANAMNIDVDMVQRKIRMLMSQYRRELFRTKNSSKWFAFQKLSFLKTRQVAVSFKKRRRPTCFVSVDRNREEQRSKPMHHSNEQIIEKLALKDRISIIQERKAQERDEYTTYGELVAMKLQKIENSYARSTAQFHINNILYKAEIGAFDQHPRLNNPFSENLRAGSSSTPHHDSNYDEHSQRSYSPTKQMDYDMKFQIEDSD